MFDVGFTEILLIGIVALVVIGPERLPAVAKTAGQWVSKLQRFVRGVKTDLASELETGDLKKLIGDQREQINELKNIVSSAKKDFESSTREVAQGAKKSLEDLETSLNESEQTASAKVAGSGTDDPLETSTDATPTDASTTTSDTLSTDLGGASAIDEGVDMHQIDPTETPVAPPANTSGVEAGTNNRTGTESGS